MLHKKVRAILTHVARFCSLYYPVNFRALTVRITTATHIFTSQPADVTDCHTLRLWHWSGCQGRKVLIKFCENWLTASEVEMGHMHTAL
jgi:hypothetical protein